MVQGGRKLPATKGKNYALLGTDNRMIMTKPTLKDWIVAMRPWSFPASIVPILVVNAWMYFYSSAHGLSFNWTTALLLLPCLVLIHAGGNMVSDYHDDRQKVDDFDSLNGVVWIRNGLFSAGIIRRYGSVMAAAGFALGVYLWWGTGFDLGLLVIGLIGLFLAFGYYVWKFHAFGDLNILLSFGILPCLAATRIVLGTYLPEVVLVCLPFAALTVSILHANNTRDILRDHRAGIVTLPMLTGVQASKNVYCLELIAPYVLTVVLSIAGLIPYTTLITFLVIPMAIGNIRTMRLVAATSVASQGGSLPAAGFDAPIAMLDQATAKMQLTFGLLYTVGLAIGAVIF